MEDIVSQFNCMLNDSPASAQAQAQAPTLIEGNITESAPYVQCDNTSILKPYQNQVLCQMIAHENVDSFDLPCPYNKVYNTHTIVSMPPGSGKTITALQMCKFAQYPQHIDPASSFEFFIASGPGGSMGLTMNANSESLPNRDATLIIVPPHLLNHWSECAHMVMKWTLNKEYCIEKFNTGPRTVKKRRVDTPSTDGCMCVIMAATRTALHGAGKFMWRRIIIDEPELLSRALPIPLAYHSFIMTASTDELYTKKTCCMSSTIQHLRDFEKKTSFAVLERIVVHLDKDYYKRHQLFSSNAKVHTVLGASVLASMVCEMPNGMTAEATMAVNMSDYQSLAQITKLGVPGASPIETVDDFCAMVEECAERAASVMSVVSSAQQAALVVKISTVRDNIEKIKSEKDNGGPAKVAMLLSLLASNPGRSLIICRYGIPLVVQALQDNGIEFADLTAHMKPDDLALTLESVRSASSSTKVIVLNPKFYARGLDVQFVENLYIMHSIGQSVATQWLGRALRQNRTCDLNVGFLLTDCEPSMF